MGESVISHSALFLTLVLALFSVLVAVSIYYYRRSYGSDRSAWDSLLARLIEIDKKSVAEIALDFIDESGRRRPSDDPVLVDPSEIWSLIGGMEGLEKLEQNSKVLVDIAFFVQRWHPEALPITEQLRQSAREIEWHVGRLRGAAQAGNLERSFPGYAQRAVAIYYMMTRRVLALYEERNVPMTVDLRRAL
jgi:hypothetical protein